MNKLHYILLSILILMFSLNGLTQNNCSTPYLFESGNTYGYNLDTNVVNQDSLINYTCLLFIEPNPLWLYFGVCDTTGSMVINVSSSNSGFDYNYIAWGPLSSPFDCNLTGSQIVACNNIAGPNDINISGLQYGYYKIMITNYSNQPDSVTITQTGGSAIACSNQGCPVFIHQLCKVSTDVSTNKNIISWEQDSLFSGKFYIQKETVISGIYATIDSISSGPPLSKSYIDNISNPIQQSFRYRLQILDSCGVTKTSNYHQTIHLQTSVNQVTSYPQLSWNPYIGFNYSTYYIYRGTSPSTVSLYDSISTTFTTYTDVNPLAGNLYYSIGVNLPSPCTFQGALKTITESSFSNVAPVTVVSVEEYNQLGFSLYPNPANDKINISFGNKSITAELLLLDIYGRKITSKIYNNTSRETLDVSGLSRGYYIISIITSDGVSGRTTFIKN